MATLHGMMEPNDSEMDTGDDLLSSSCPGGEASRHSRCTCQRRRAARGAQGPAALVAVRCGGSDPSLPGAFRLARKAESARQARLRHKQFVQELQDQVSVLNGRLAQSELQPSAHQAVCELKGALTPEQFGTLVGWCARSHLSPARAGRSSRPQLRCPRPCAAAQS